MDNQQFQPVQNQSIWTIILPTIIITALIVGGGIWYWQKSISEKEGQEKIASTPEEAIMLFTSALIEGNTEKALDYVFLGEATEDRKVIIDRFEEMYGNKSREELIKYGEKIQSGSLGKYHEEYTGRAEWDVEFDFDGKTIITPTIIIKAGNEGWKIQI